MMMMMMKQQQLMMMMMMMVVMVRNEKNVNHVMNASPTNASASVRVRLAVSNATRISRDRICSPEDR